MRTWSGRWLAGMVCLGGTLPAAAFDTDEAESEVRSQYAQISRPSAALPDTVYVEENITYATREAELLQLDLYRLNDKHQRPAIMLIHGGGWDSGNRRMERPLAIQLAVRGFVVVTVDYRLGADGRFPANLHDVKSAVRWLRADAGAHNIDVRNIGVMGFSAGGQLAALLGATNGMEEFEGVVGVTGVSSTVQAVVDVDGLVDFTARGLVEQQVARPSAPTRYLGGAFATHSDTWRQASPLTHAGPHCAPILFINSTARTPLLPGREEMAAKLRELGIEARIEVIPDSPHTLWLFNPWFGKVVELAAEFFQRHLSEDPLDTATEGPPCFCETDD